MAFWNSIKEQMLALWSRWTIAQRVGLSAAAIACVAAVVGTMIWASQPDYVVLVSNIPSSRVAEIAGMLDTEKITYKLNISGTAISVASSDLAKARMAVGDELEPGESGKDEEISWLPGSPEDASARRLRTDERRIREMIEDIREVRSARVSIGRPPETPFAIEQTPVTASVIVEPRSGGRLSGQTAQTIMHIVADAVPGLKLDRITLSDNNGNQYGNKAGMESELEMQLAYKRSIEREIAREAESFLKQMSGVRAIVKVAAEVDFSSIEETRSTVDPETKVTLSERVSSSKHDGLLPQPAGAAGTPNNIPAPAAAANAQGTGGTSKTEESETTSKVSETQQKVINPRGKVTRISVAAVVDVQAPPAGAAPDPNNPAPVAQGMTQQELEDLLKSAVGYQLERNDEVRVTLRPLIPDDVDVPVATGFVWEQWQPLVQYTSLGLAALLAFFIGMMLMKRMKPIVITETVGPGIPLADARRLAVLSEQAKSNPDVVASILSAWLNEQEQTAVNPAAAAQGRDAYRAASSGSDRTAGTSAANGAGANGSRTSTSSGEGKRAA